MQALCAALFLTTLLPAPPVEDTEAEVLRVDWSRALPGDPDLAALRREYASAVNARDARRASDLYTNDALAMLGDGRVVRGAEAIGARLGALNSPGAVVTLLPQRFSSAATVASETGTFTEALVGREGATTVEGVYVAVYSRHPGGRWRIALEVRTTGRSPALAVW
jgi:ketosteroid isomerase-like protein